MDIVDNIPKENQTHIQLLNFIKDKLTDDEQLLFAESFHLYLQYDDEKDFVIELDNIWKWLGFTQRVNCKKLLIKNFEENKDYKIFKNYHKENFAFVAGKAKNESPDRGIEKRGGYNKEQIMITIKTFKKLCMKASTKKADEIHDYYLKLEKCNHDFILHTLQQQNEETQKLLKEKDDQIKILQKPIYFDVPKEQWIYIMQEICKEGQNIYKIGLASKGVDKRKKSYKCYASDGFKEIFRFNTNNCFLLENIVKQLLYKYKYRHVSEKGGTEYFECDVEYIKNIIKISGTFIDTLFGTHENITKSDLIKYINNNLFKNLYGSEEYIKTFLPETILNSCQDIFNENHKNIKKKLKKHLDKTEINDITDNICNDFNEAIHNILPPESDFDLDEYLEAPNSLNN